MGAEDSGSLRKFHRWTYLDASAGGARLLWSPGFGRVPARSGVEPSESESRGWWSALSPAAARGALRRPRCRISAVGSTCQQLSAVLSDGPDPGADPVGYALAQILPLRRLHSSDGALQTAIDGLATAYQDFTTAKGGKEAAKAVRKASEKVDAICPGAAS